MAEVKMEAGTKQVNYFETPPGMQMQVLERQGCPIHYWVGGREQAPAVLLMHGALMDHRMFNAQVPWLMEQYRVIAWDGRGHGRSQPIGLGSPTITDYCADALAVLDAVGAEKAVLVGQSMGAYVAQHLLRGCRERALALVVIGSTPVAFAVKGWEMWALEVSGPMMGWWPWNSLKPLMAKNTALQAETIRYALSAMDQVDRRTFLSIWKAVSGAVRREGYPDFRVDVPFLLTHGEFDRTGTIVRDGPRWAASDPRIEYKVIPQAGHNANQDNPAEFNRVLMDFLQNTLGL
jgi:3-oxoadipate enol-lactonase